MRTKSLGTCTLESTPEILLESVHIEEQDGSTTNYTADNGTVSFQTTFTNTSIGMLILYTLADVPNPTLVIEQYDMESGEYVEPSPTVRRGLLRVPSLA